MSSKKASSKETKPVAKKAPAKKPAEKAPAKKPAEKAPAKKTAAASAAKKPAKAPAKDVKAAKPAPKAAAKPAAKPAKAEPKKASAKPASKAAAKPVAKPAKAEPKKVAAKPAPKAAAKPAAKSVKAEPKKATKEVKVEKKAAAKATKEEPKKVAAKPAKAEPKKAEKEVKADKKASVKAAKVEPKVEEVKVEPVAEKKGKKVNDPKPEVVVEPETKVEESKPKKGLDADYAVLLEGVKKLSKTVMFVEIDEQEDRSNKKKMSSEMKNLEMKPTASIRHKISLAEETQEELTERILKELEEQNLAFEREAATQMCTRCNRNLVSPEFWVDKHLGYCEECAMILKLGQSKEARKVEYQLGAMGGDSLDEEDDEIMGPDADDLKEAEEDLADLDD